MDQTLILSGLLNDITSDVTMDPDVKKKVIEAINEVMADPTVDNLRALQALISALGDASRFVGALDDLEALVDKE